MGAGGYALPGGSTAQQKHPGAAGGCSRNCGHMHGSAAHAGRFHCGATPGLLSIMQWRFLLLGSFLRGRTDNA